MTDSTLISPNKYKGRQKPIRLFVLHSTESNEVATGAEGNAKYFNNPKVRASSHVVGDNNSRVRVVNDEDTAWTTPGVNSESLNYELVGRAGQTAAQWNDEYSRAAITLAAKQFAEWHKKYPHVPIKKLSDAELKAGHKGIIGHDNASRVYKQSSHWDPGPNFPWDWFIALIKQFAGSAPAPAPAKPANNYSGKVTVDVTLPILKKGNTGPHVRLLQGILNVHGAGTAAGVGVLAEDSSFGDKTERAVEAHQKAHRLTPDKVVGVKTWPTLLEDVP